MPLLYGGPRTLEVYDLGRRHKVPRSIQADLLNAFDTQGLYNIESVFGGTHVIPPRTFAVRLRYRFGGQRS